MKLLRSLVALKSWKPARAVGVIEPRLDRRLLLPTLFAGGAAATSVLPKVASAAGPISDPLTVPPPYSLGGIGNTIGDASGISNITLGTATTTTLRALPTKQILPGVGIYVAGYYAAGDRGGGLFVWAPTSALADDGGTVINPAGNAGNGRWLRALTGPLTTRHMGAVVDGATDDSAAITAGMAAAARLGIPLTISIGTHVADTLVLPAGCSLTAEAAGRSIIARKANAAGHVLLQATNLSGFSIDGVTWDGNKANQTVGANTVVLQGCSAYHVERCSFLNARMASGYGTGFLAYNGSDDTAATASSVNDNVATGNEANGISFHGNTAQQTATRNRCYANGACGIVVETAQFPPIADQGHRIIIALNQCFGNGAHGIACGGYIAGGTAAAPIYAPGVAPERMILITDNVCRLNKQYGIVWQGKDGRVSGNICSNNGGTGTTFAGILANCEDSDIIDNTCNENEFYGIDAGGAIRVRVAGNTCKRNGKLSTSTSAGSGIDIGGSVDLDCLNNWCEDHNGVGIDCPRIDGPGGIIAFGQEATRIRIKSNRIICASTSQGAIWVRGDVLKVEVIDNKFTGVASNSNEQCVIESLDCTIRNNRGDDTSYWTLGFASGASAFLTFPDWLEDVLVNVSGTTILKGFWTRTVSKYSASVYKVVVAGASGWSSVPTVSFSGGGGSGAAAKALIDNTGNLWIVVTNPGTGYTSAPAVMLTGGNGTVKSVTASTTAGNMLNGNEMRLFFTGPLTIINGLIHLSGGANRTTTGKSTLTVRGYSGAYYEVGSSTGMS